MDKFNATNGLLNIKPDLFINYLSASYNGSLYVIFGVLCSYITNKIHVYIGKKWKGNTENNEDVPMLKLLIEFMFHTFTIIMMVLLIKYIVPKVPSPFGFLRNNFNLGRDVTTGAVLLAFSVLMYVDEYKKNIKLIVERLTNLID